VGVKLQLPEASAVVLPSTVLPSLMVTTLLAVAVPTKVGVVSLVVPPALTSPITPGASSVALVMVIDTAEVSMLKGLAELWALVLPAGSVAVMVALWLPDASGVLGVKLQVPPVATVALPMAEPLS